VEQIVTDRMPFLSLNKQCQSARRNSAEATKVSFSTTIRISISC